MTAADVVGVLLVAFGASALTVWIVAVVRVNRSGPVDECACGEEWMALGLDHVTSHVRGQTAALRRHTRTACEWIELP